MRYTWRQIPIGHPYVWEKKGNAVHFSKDRRGSGPDAKPFKVVFSWTVWTDLLDNLQGFNYYKWKPNLQTLVIVRNLESRRDQWVTQIKAHVDGVDLDIEMSIHDWNDLVDFMSLEPKPIQGGKASLLLETER